MDTAAHLPFPPDQGIHAVPDCMALRRRFSLGCEGSSSEDTHDGRKKIDAVKDMRCVGFYLCPPQSNTELLLTRCVACVKTSLGSGGILVGTQDCQLAADV